MKPRRSSENGWGTGDYPLLLVSLAGYLIGAWTFFGRTADDAFISYRYALNWAAGCGPVFSCGETPVEGYTNFLWVALAALVIKLGGDPLEVMRILSLACGAACFPTLILLCKKLHLSRAAQLIPLLGLATCPFWAVNSAHGLETLPAALSILVAAYLSLDLPGRPRAWGPGLAWGVSYLIRPEGIALATLTCCWSFLSGVARGHGTGRTLKGTFKFGLGFLAVAGPYFIWRMYYYQSLFPNTFMAKREPLEALLPRNFKLLLEHGSFFGLLIAAALLVVLVRRTAPQLYILTLALGSIAISMTVHNNFWMAGHRLYMTATALTMLLAGGVADFAWKRFKWSGLLLAFLALGAVIYGNMQAVGGTRALAETHYAQDNHPLKAMGRKIRELARPGDWLVIRDAGMVPFYAGSKVKVLDMHDKSLNDRHIATQGWSLDYVMSREPRFVVLMSYYGRSLRIVHPLEGQIVNGPGFRKKYRLLMTAAWHPTRHFFLYYKE